DQYAFHRLSAEIEDMQKWLQLGGGPSTFDAWEWLSDLPGETRVMGSGPRPGCMHVAPALSGGHTGRPNTFIIGLDDNRFPGGGFQDPLRDDLAARLAELEKPRGLRALWARLFGRRKSRPAKNVAAA